jgi:predicted ATP pyrophosphatase (TIGR00289 family)
MRVAALISGGKDSMLAAHEIAESHELITLIGVIPERDDSYMFHTVNLHMLDAVAECMDLPMIKIRVSGEEEREVDELISSLKELDVDAVCVGGIESQYQKNRFERVCKRLGLKLIAPLWKVDPEELMSKVISNFEVIIVGVFAMGLDETFLGRKIDGQCLIDLKEIKRKYKIHIAGEGGEYETLVLDAPLYKKKIEIISAEKVYSGMSGYLRIKEYSLVKK